MLKIVGIGQSSFCNVIVQFCQDRRQSGRLTGFDEVVSLPTKRRLVGEGA
jgi:hypothetical protein